jgi:hypothetical protein
MGIDAPYGGNFTSHYDQSSNRCYVKVSSRTDSSRQAVYDGQTRELLVSVDLSLKAIFVTGVAGSECQEPQGAACASAAIRKMDELMLETPADKK